MSISPTAATSRPLNDRLVARSQRAASEVLVKALSPLEARIEKAQVAHRDKALLRPFCNILERNLHVVLDQESYIWGDNLRLNTCLVEAIESSPLDEAAKNHAVFWLLLFHTSYFALGYQNRFLRLISDDPDLEHAAFAQATLRQMSSFGLVQPDPAPFWEGYGFVFRPLMPLKPGVAPEEEVLAALRAGSVAVETLTRTPVLRVTEIQAAIGNLADFHAQTHDTFAREIINDWMAEFTKCNSFGDTGINGIRLLYFKAHPPRDVGEAILDCLRSKYPVADDLALYNNKKLANDYFAPRAADPVEETTGHIELYIDCSGSVAAEQIGDCIRVFTSFFARRKKRMTFGLNCFDTSILSRVVVGIGEDPAEKLTELAILGGGGTDFRCTAAQIQALVDQGAPHASGTGIYKADLAVVFTDLAGTFPETTPCDFVWVTTTKDCDLRAVTSNRVPGTIIYL